jgi:colicin import membrane protein
MRRRKPDAGEAREAGRVTPKDIQDVEFRLAFRGYNERDVDAFLDRVTEDLASYLEELEELRAKASAATALDVPAASAEAERILEEARQEAARIVEEARREAERILEGSRAAALGGGDARAVVAPFLNREREFLQSLGSLVQAHAEEIKAMVLALRARPAAERPAAEAAAAPEPAREPQEARGAEEGSSGPTAEEAFAPISVPEAEQDRGEGEAWSEPSPASAELRRDSGERSLRELFWGED